MLPTEQLSKNIRTFAPMKHLLTLMAALMLLTCCTTQADRTRMRAGLDSINQRNRNDLPFTADDVLPYADFFDSHGTPNDLMLAHYLLGRAYHEQGEAPMAIQCYQDAIERADTTSTDCDYYQLCRVYGQMADVLYLQSLYKEQLQALQKGEHYAWMAKDTLTALIGYERRTLPYREFGMMDSVEHIADKASGLYEQYGYKKQAAVALCTAIDILIEKGKYLKAHKCIDVYEHESEMFDSAGNILPGYELYYHHKGLLCLSENKLDSAELLFRKELKYGEDYNNQNAASLGLAMTFDKLHLADSAAKYYRYAYQMNDSVFFSKVPKEIEQIQAMYKYQRLQDTAVKATKTATKRTFELWVVSALLLFICLIGYILFQHINLRKKEIERKYLKSLSDIEQARHDLQELKNFEEENKVLIAEKEEFIREQTRKQISLLENDRSHSIANKTLHESQVYCGFDHLAATGVSPMEKDWKLLETILSQTFPGFYTFMEEHKHLLNDKEYKTCLLIRIGIGPNAICKMLGTAPSYISKIRTRMLALLFGEDGNSKLFDIRIRNIY